MVQFPETASIMGKSKEFFIHFYEACMTIGQSENRSKIPSSVGKADVDPGFAEAVLLPEDSDNELVFYKLYAKLVSAMTAFEVDVDLVENLLIKMCQMFRLSKAETKVYQNEQDERDGNGETLCCYDNGKEGSAVRTFRVETSVMTRAVMTTYMSPDEKPLNEDELEKLDLVMRTVVSYISRNRMRDALYKFAFFDEKGYPNLRNWFDHLGKAIAQKQTRDRLSFRYNLRHFSLINQEFGRETGDVIMESHFNKLVELLGEDSFIARLGGDNFLGICPSEKTRIVVDYLTETEVRTPKGVGVNISTSAGFYRVPNDHDATLDEIMSSMISAYRVAQTGGMDNTVFYDESFRKSREKSMKIHQQFSEALEKNEFQPFYQPKVNVLDGSLVGAEALCRWFRGGKVIPPAEFIPFLEETSEICRLDFNMLESVCKDLKRWADEGREPKRVSINFSRKHILNTYFPETIAEIVDKYSVPHELIEVELTETTSEIEYGELRRMANGLRDLGFHISIDDFGIGYSSLNLIKDIPWSTLKIDKAFLPEETEGESSMNSIMFRHVVSMARQLGLECISEGVETLHHVDILKKYGCDIAQGYFFDKPLSVADFEQRLSRGRYDI